MGRLIRRSNDELVQELKDLQQILGQYTVDLYGHGIDNFNEFNNFFNNFKNQWDNLITRISSQHNIPAAKHINFNIGNAIAKINGYQQSDFTDNYYQTINEIVDLLNEIVLEIEDLIALVIYVSQNSGV